ncbi:hypothetical protein CR513_06258, partial [Mucuna pruriens]
MARFFNSLNRDIQDVVEFHEYTYISTLVHQASKVESQLRRHGKKAYLITSSNWKVKERREDESPKGTKVLRRGMHPSKAKKKRKGYIASQCPSKRTMILRDNEDIESESSQEETSTQGVKVYTQVN